MPIIVTGNDLSTLFAPLVRDGRMAKFYWQPSRNDLQNILHQMYKVCLIDAPRTQGSTPAVRVLRESLSFGTVALGDMRSVLV